MDHGHSMPLGEHLEELRRRLILCLVVIGPVFALALVIGRRLLAFLLLPVERALLRADLPPFLQATSPVETFAAYVKVSFILTVVVVSPWILYQLWKFVAPGLYANERRFAYLLAPLSVTLTTLGMVFLYTVMLPVVLTFFIHFGITLAVPDTRTAPAPAGTVMGAVPVLELEPERVEPGDVWVNSRKKQLRICVGVDRRGDPIVLGTPLIGAGLVAQQYKVSEYVRFFLSLVLAFAVGFQMPVVVLLLGWAGIVTPAMLGAYRRHIAMLCAVLGAVMTPADPFSLILLALPLYLLFELGVVLLRLLPASRVARGMAGMDSEEEHRGE